MSGEPFGCDPRDGVLTRFRSPSLTVCKFVSTFGAGGTELQVLGLAENFDPHMFKLSFGCLSNRGMTEVVRGGKKWPVREFPINHLVSLAAGGQMLRLARHLRKLQPQVLHSYNFYGNVFSLPAARLAGVPCIVASIRDMGVYLTPRQKQLQRWVCRLADRVVVNAEAIRAWLIDQGYESSKIRVIRNGARIPVIDRTETRSRIRSRLGIPHGARVVIMVSRLNPQKGIEDLIRAGVELSRRVPEVRFLVVGGPVLNYAADEGDYMDTLAAQASRLGIGERFLFTGMRHDVPELLQAADVAVLPSLSEGLPNSVIEAMASGLPVVATAVGGIPELISHGRSGLLVPPGDIAALNHALAMVLDDPRLAERLGAAARLRIQAGFSFEKMCLETEALYRAVLLENGFYGRAHATARRGP